MIRFDTPLREQHEQYVNALVDRPGAAAEEINRPGAATGGRIAPPDVEYLPYGPRDDSGQVPCEIIGTFGEVQAEYAAIRNGAGIFDCPHRATIRVTGGDRREFLNSMMTAELKNLEKGDSREAFWLNRKGRIEADLLLAEFGEEILIDVDVHALDRTVSSLESFLFAEDVELGDAHERYHRLTIHGKRAIEVIAESSSTTDFSLENHQCAQLPIANQPVSIVRCDQTGEIGMHLFAPREGAKEVWQALLATDEPISGGKRRVRPIGWYGFNIARIEAGTPLFNIDFSVDNLPHETGILNNRVSFTKGCFLGQEVVARMQHLGRPKKILVSLRMEDDLLPVEGAPVYTVADAESGASGSAAPGEQIGVITSSTLSPMLGAHPVAFAMLTAKDAPVHGRVLVEAEGKHARAAIGELNMLARPGEAATDGANSMPHHS